MEEKIEHEKYDNFQASEKLKIKIIDYLMATCTTVSDRQEPISGETWETPFIRRIPVCISMLEKWTPNTIKTQIKELNQELDDALKEIDESDLSQTNKLLNKRIIADKKSLQILQFLLVVLQNSPINTEMTEMEIFPEEEDFKDFIEIVRSKHKVTLHSGEKK